MCKMTHVINVEIKDNHDDATLGAFLIHELVKEVGSFILQISVNSFSGLSLFVCQFIGFKNLSKVLRMILNLNIHLRSARQPITKPRWNQ